jgi:phytoene synthase
LPEALLEGFEWDAENRRYETLDELVAYAVRVAGTVGGMMALLMGRSDPAVLARAMELGVAMQLTNIARDVGEDARNGRLYLPLRWLRDAGLDPKAFMRRPEFGPALGQVVQRLLDSADLIYQRAEEGIGFLPVACRPAIAAARVLYAEIGHAVARNGFDSVSRRAVVSTVEKLSCMPQIGAIAIAPPVGSAVPALAEAQFLIDAIAPKWTPALARDADIPWWRLGARAIRFIELLERIERREQLRRS